jgi:integrase
VLSIERMQEGRRVQSLYLFPTRSGGAYTASGVKATWNRIVTLALKEGVITADTRFTFHDLRAYYVTEHKAEHLALPDLHANPETTARVYDRNKEVRRRAL